MLYINLFHFLKQVAREADWKAVLLESQAFKQKAFSSDLWWSRADIVIKIAVMTDSFEKKQTDTTAIRPLLKSTKTAARCLETSIMALGHEVHQIPFSTGK